jgi:ribosome-binding factor A
MKTCRRYVVDIINDLDKIANNTSVPGVRTAALNKATVYFALLDVLVRTDLDKDSSKYAEALAALKKAEKATKKALEDIGKVAEAIKKATKAAKVLDGILGAFLSL